MKIAFSAACALALATTPLIADDHEPAQEQVQRVYVDYVSAGQYSAYETVTGEWNACITEADSSLGWNVWEAETGHLGRYAFVVNMQPWAEFDRERPELKGCYEQFRDRYYATIHKTMAAFDIYLPEHSNHVENDKNYTVAMVTTFRLHDQRAFMENVKKYTQAAKENEWQDSYYFYSTIGGKGGGDMYVVSPATSFADFDGDSGFWKMLAEHFGEEEFARLRAKDRKSIDHYYTDIWTLNEELSHSPEE